MDFHAQPSQTAPPSGQTVAAILGAKAPSGEGKSLEAFLASLAVAGGTFALEILIYLWFRTRLPDIYKFDGSLFGGEGAIDFAHHGLDTYLFLRYLRTLLIIFIPLALVLLPVLLPLNYIRGRGGPEVSGLDQLSWTNVSSENTHRYWAHLVLALTVAAWVCHVARFELLKYTQLRHRRLASNIRSSTTTILVTDIPTDLLDDDRLRKLYDIFPHGVRTVSINKDCSKLAKVVEEREKVVIALEKAETRLIQKVQRANRSRRTEIRPDEAANGSGSSSMRPLWTEHLGRGDRETLRLPTQCLLWKVRVPYVGRIVDTIDYLRQELDRLNIEISDQQRRPQDFRLTDSAFIRFNRPIGAHMASQSVQHLRPHTMIARPAGEAPTDILWQNVSMTWLERYVRAYTVGIFAVALIVVATGPVAFTGLLSQVPYLVATFPSLQRLKTLPVWVLATLQGVLPACLFSTVMLGLPLLLYFMLSLQGTHTHVAAELLMQDYYFYFLFIQLFIVVSTSSSIAAVLSGSSRDATALATLIAQNLPKAGNYFFSYMVLQALSVSAATLLQAGRLVLLLVGFFTDNTPREKWQRRQDPVIKWGTFFPFYTNLAVIGLIYSVVSPLILIFNIITFSSILVVHYYYTPKAPLDTGGLFYPKAIHQLFLGLYVMEAYLIGLFFLVRNEDGDLACIAQGVIMILAMFFTLAYQVLLSQAFRPLIQHLPAMLDSDKVLPEVNNTRDTGRWYHRCRRVFERALDLGQEPLGRVAVADEEIEDEALCPIENSALTAKQTTVWIPHDELGISGDEIRQTRQESASVSISDANATLSEKGSVESRGDPPALAP